MKLAPWPVRSILRAKPTPPDLSNLAHKTAAKWRALSTFRINTCKSVSKQRTLTPCRMNTYEKPGGGGYPVPRADLFRAIGSLHRLGAIRSIDADILRCEIAGPVAGGGRTGVQMHDDGHMVG